MDGKLNQLSNIQINTQLAISATCTYNALVHTFSVRTCLLPSPASIYQVMSPATYIKLNRYSLMQSSRRCIRAQAFF